MRDFFVNTIGTLTATAIVALAAFLWNGLFRPMFDVSPGAFVVYSILCLLVGMIAGFLIGWSARKLRDKTRKDEQRDLSDPKLLNWIANMDTSYKWALAMLYVDGCVKKSSGSDFEWLLDDAASEADEGEQDFFHESLTNGYEQSDGYWTYELKPHVRKLLKKNKKALGDFVDKVRDGESAKRVGELRTIYQVSEKRLKPRKKASRDPERDRRIEESLLTFKRDQDGKKKALAAVIYGYPEHRVAVNDMGNAEIRHLDNKSMTSFFIFDDRDDHVVVELEPWLVELFDARPEETEGFTQYTISDVLEFFEHTDPF